MINSKKLVMALEEQELLINKIKNHKNIINKYQKENDELYSKLLNIRKNNRYNIWFSILSYLLEPLHHFTFVCVCLSYFPFKINFYF